MQDDDDAARLLATQLYAAATPEARVEAWRSYVELADAEFAADSELAAALIEADDIEGLVRHAGRYRRSQAAAASAAIRLDR